LSKPLRVSEPLLVWQSCEQLLTGRQVIARNALAQEEADEFSGDFQDPINIHIDNDRDGCAC
jgi:hypothetical protein